jgi:hypothetical protein
LNQSEEAPKADGGAGPTVQAPYGHAVVGTQIEQAGGGDPLGIKKYVGDGTGKTPIAATTGNPFRGRKAT